MFFSTSASKEDLYILPVVPAAAALIAEALIRSGFGRTNLVLRALFAAVCVICLALAILVATTLRTGPYAIADAWIVAGVLAVAGIGGLAFVIARRFPAAVLTFAAAFVAFNYLLVARVLPLAESSKPVPPIAAVLQARASPGSPLGSLNMMLPSLVYYANRTMTEVLARPGRHLARGHRRSVDSDWRCGMGGAPAASASRPVSPSSGRSFRSTASGSRTCSAASRHRMWCW